MTSLAPAGASDTGQLFIANEVGSEELAAPQPIKPIVFNPPHGWTPQVSVLEAPEATQAMDVPSPEQEANGAYYSQGYGDDGTYAHEQQQQQQYGQDGLDGYVDDDTYEYEQQQQQEQQYGEDGLDRYGRCAENDMYSGEQYGADGTGPGYGYDGDGAGQLREYEEEQLVGYEGDGAYPPEQYEHGSAYPHEHDEDGTDAYRSHEDISPPLEEYVEDDDDRYEEERDELDSPLAHDESEVDLEEEDEREQEREDDDDDDGDSRVCSGLNWERVGRGDWAAAGHGHGHGSLDDGPRVWPQPPELSPDGDDDAAYRRSLGLPQQMADAADRVRGEDDDSQPDDGGDGDSESRYSSVTGGRARAWGYARSRIVNRSRGDG